MGEGKWADCWQESRDDYHVTWGYTIQGTEGQTTLVINKNGVGWTTAPDDVLKERATLEFTYVKQKIASQVLLVLGNICPPSRRLIPLDS